MFPVSTAHRIAHTPEASLPKRRSDCRVGATGVAARGYHTTDNPATGFRAFLSPKIPITAPNPADSSLSGATDTPDVSRDTSGVINSPESPLLVKEIRQQFQPAVKTEQRKAPPYHNIRHVSVLPPVSNTGVVSQARPTLRACCHAMIRINRVVAHGAMNPFIRNPSGILRFPDGSPDKYPDRCKNQQSPADEINIKMIASFILMLYRIKPAPTQEHHQAQPGIENPIKPGHIPKRPVVQRNNTHSVAVTHPHGVGIPASRPSRHCCKSASRLSSICCCSASRSDLIRSFSIPQFITAGDKALRMPAWTDAMLAAALVTAAQAEPDTPGGRPNELDPSPIDAALTL